MQNKYPRGQVGLLLLVIMGVVVALVLSVASRSLSDTVLSRQERESSAAFAVAETGIESALSALQAGESQGIGGPLTDVGNFVSGNYQVANLSSYSLYLREGETAHLDLVGFGGPTITIEWTRKNDNSEDLACGTEGSGGSAAAIEVNAIKETTDTVVRSYYNASNCTLYANGFEDANDGGDTYRSAVSLTLGDPLVLPAGVTALRIKPIYAGATVAASGNNLQTQLYKIQSKASGGDAQKEIEVKRGLDAPSSIFDFAVFTSGTIQKGS